MYMMFCIFSLSLSQYHQSAQSMHDSPSGIISYQLLAPAPLASEQSTIEAHVRYRTLSERNMRHCVSFDRVGMPWVLVSSSHQGCHSTAGAPGFSPSGSPAAESADPIHKCDLDDSLPLTQDLYKLLPLLLGTIPAAIQAQT